MQKISKVSDQYFLSYVKKKLQGGIKLTPPPSRNRVNKTYHSSSIKLHHKYNLAPVLRNWVNKDIGIRKSEFVTKTQLLYI